MAKLARTPLGLASDTQNHTFRDHYLDLDLVLDLSEVPFLATPNVRETIPFALLDGMELIKMDGYAPQFARGPSSGRTRMRSVSSRVR